MSIDPLAGGRTSTDKVQLSERVEASTRTNWKQPLSELGEDTGGFAVLDTNDYRKPMERLAADLGGFYEITYTPSSAAWDVIPWHCGDSEPQRSAGAARQRLHRDTPDESGPVLAYELPLLDALKAAGAKKDFPVTASTFAFGSSPEGREVALIAELPISSFKVTSDTKAKLYKLHFALLALVEDGKGQAVERVSQDYPFQGPLDKLPQLQRGNVVFRRKLVVPPGSYTLELAAQDRESAATSVYRTPLTVAAPQGLGVSSVVIEPRRRDLEGDAPELPVYVVVYPVAGAGAPQTLEFSAEGRPEGRNTVMLPAPDPDGRIRFLAPIPIDRYAPRRHELKVTVRQGSASAEEKVAFTLQPWP